MTNLPRVILRPRRARPFFARHPWVFAGSIERVEGEPGPGAEVEVLSYEGKFIARGLFNPASAIRARLYRWEPAPLDDSFWRDRVAAAWRLRVDLLGLGRPGSGCRAIFSEADGLSGLVVDRYDRWLVAQFTGLALYQRRLDLAAILAEVAGVEGVILRVDRALAEPEGLPADGGDEVVGRAPDGPVTIVEDDLRFEVDLRGGQKTGFYLDQRDNRRAVARYARGRRVLDLFCYSGGFSLYALGPGGAAAATGIDSSAPAVELARRNAAANGLEAARFEQDEAFRAIEALRLRGERFGLVVCDPPKFARHARAVDEAIKGYLRLNRSAVDLLEPDGVLATCSCSGHVSRDQLAEVLGQVAELSGRPIQVLEQRGQAPDHPIAASCLETEYLKCFICRVG